MDTTNEKIKVTKKEVMLNIVIPIISFVLGVVVSVLITFYIPEQDDKIVRKNRIGGNNQMKIKEMPAVHSFEEYLHYIERKDTARMWNLCTFSWQRHFMNAGNMLYQFYLTSKYEVKYIIPKSDNSFYVYLRFEDEVFEDEVERLKKFHNTRLSEVSIEGDFEQVLDETFEFVNNRFIIDNEEIIKEELKDYMMNMTIRDYVTQDWRFSMNFAQNFHLPMKQEDHTRITVRQGHDMICEVEMIKDMNEWKLDKFQTIAISRW